MSFTAYRRMISPVLSRARELKRRPLALHPIPGSSKKVDCTQQKNHRLSAPEFQAHPHWNHKSFSGSSRVGMKSRFQAHFWIGICCRNSATRPLARARMWSVWRDNTKGKPRTAAMRTVPCTRRSAGYRRFSANTSLISRPDDCCGGLIVCSGLRFSHDPAYPHCFVENWKGSFNSFFEFLCELPSGHARDSLLHLMKIES